MALSPSQVSHPDQELLRIVDQEEEQLDMLLRVRGLDSRGRGYFPIAYLDQRVKDELTRRYQDAGWKVAWRTDEHGNGFAIELSRPRDVMAEILGR